METIGRYRVVRPLGHGGMGQVFLAEDPKLERRVALKLLHRPDLAHIGLAAEAKALAALNHPGIVTIYEIGEHENRDFIAMEYLPGKTLRELVEAGTPRATLLAICAKVATAVAAAHRAGILHRDIKPENVVVTETGDVKVVDFGVARRLEEHTRPPQHQRAVTAQDLVDTLATLAGADTVVTAGTVTVFGTPAYMAPEVLLGEGSTAASDVYSLGIVVYECLAGHRPYLATALVEVIANMIDHDAPELSGDPHARLVAAMLARDPAARPALADIARALAPERHARRPRRPMALAAGVVVAAVAGVVIWQLSNREPAAPVATPHEPIAIGVAPVVANSLIYGTESPHPSHVAKTLARLLADVEGAHVTAVELEPGKEAGTIARYQIAATITDHGKALRARLVITDLSIGRTLDVVELEQPRLAALLTAIAIETARTIVPAATLAPQSKVRARAFIQLGMPYLERARFNDARPYFEQAVDSDPSSPDAWYHLALVLAWMEAPEDQLVEAAHQAVQLAPEGRRRRVMRGVELFLLERYREAREQLEHLAEPLAGPRGPDRREVLYFLGEACWHDGRFAEANDHFKRALADDDTFRPATIHAVQYALAHGDCNKASYMIGLSGENPDALAICAGELDGLTLRANAPSYQMAAYLLLEREPPTALAAKAYLELDASAYTIARAVAAGDREAARAAFADGWRRFVVESAADAWKFYAIEQLGEIVIAAGMIDEARTIVAYLTAQSQHRTRRGYHRFAALAAALAGDPALVVRDRLTERSANLVRAVDAELAGDRAGAVAQLEALLADPSFFWDYPERAALLRNLAALGRTRDIAKHCEAWRRPPVFRLAYLPLRAACVSATGRRAPDRRGRPRR